MPDMIFVGKISNDTVLLPPGTHLADGTEVRIEPVAPPAAADRKARVAALRQLAASLDGLPADLAKNHDHYISGTPRR